MHLRSCRGISAIIFCCLAGSPAFAGDATTAPSASTQATILPATQPTTQAAAIEIPEKNLLVDAPPPGWERVPARRMVGSSALEFSLAHPEILCSFVAEVPSPDPEMKSEKLLQTALDRFSATSSDFTLVEKKPQTVDGLHGVRGCVRIVSSAGKNLVVVCWAYACPHGFYQVQVIGNQEDEDQVRSEAQKMIGLFHFKDPALASIQQTLPAYHSATYGYSVKFDQPGWVQVAAKSRDSTAPTADFWAMHGLNTALMVVPVSIADLDVDRDALAKVLLKRVNFSFDDLTDVKPITLGKTKGISFTFSRDVKAIHYDYQGEMLSANGFGYMAIAWTSKADQVQELPQVLDAFSLDKSASPPDPVTLTPRERDAQMGLLNEMGNIAFTQQQYLRASALHQAALRMRLEPVVLENAVGDLITAQEPREALALVRKYREVVLKRPSLEARAARLEAAVGDRDTALDLYRILFAAKYEERTLLKEFVDLLAKSDHDSEALLVVQKYREQSDTTEAAILEYEIYSKMKDPEKALAVLEDRLPADKTNLELNYVLGNAYLTAKRYAEARDCAQGLVDHGSKSVYTYLQLGAAQFYLKQYRDAKATFELAAAVAPDNQGVQSWLRTTSGMLGEGDNAGIKTEIIPVALPATLQKVPPVDPAFGSDANAVYLWAATAVSFEKGKEQKTTHYYSVKVLNNAGVDEYNAFHFSFEPGSEQIYVNKLEVKDADGKVVATGSVADCFTQDSPRGQSANFERTLTIPVPGLKVGCTIDLIYTKREKAEARQFTYMQNLLSFYRPCAVNTLYVCGDLDAIKAFPTDGLKQETIDGGWSWTVSKPQPYTFEPLEADYETYLPMVTLSDASASWEKEGADYLATIKDVTKPDADAKSTAANLTSGLTSESDKLAAILKYVQGNLTYQAIEFGKRARIPNKAGQIIHNHYGDCKDHALLLHQLLDAAGIQSDLVLVRSAGVLSEQAPSMDQFDHMIVCVPGKNSAEANRFFDCTDKGTDLTVGIPFGLAGKQVLILDNDHPYLATIPEYSKGSSTVAIVRDETLAANGDLSIHDVITCKGYYASSMRRSFLQMEPKNRKPGMQDLLAGRGHIDLTVQSASFENLEHVDQPLMMDIRYTLPNRFSADGDGLVGSLPALFEHTLMVPTHVDPRLTPFAIRYPVEFSTTTHLSPPENYHLTGSVAPYAFNGAFETDSVSIKSNGDGSIEESFSGRTIAGQYPAETYASYERSRQNLLSSLERNLVLGKH